MKPPNGVWCGLRDRPRRSFPTLGTRRLGVPGPGDYSCSRTACKINFGTLDCRVPMSSRDGPHARAHQRGPAFRRPAAAVGSPGSPWHHQAMTHGRAVRFDHYGDRDVLYVAEVEIPDPGPGRGARRGPRGGHQPRRDRDPFRRPARDVSRHLPVRPGQRPGRRRVRGGRQRLGSEPRRRGARLLVDALEPRHPRRWFPPRS